MTDGLLEVSDLHKSFDGVKPLDGFSCSVRRGEIVGLVGPNGAGKTTFFNVLTGFIPADAGTAAFEGTQLLGRSPHTISDLGVGRTFQDLRLIRRISVLDNVLLAFKDQPGENLGNVFFRPGACAKREAGNAQTAASLLEGAGLVEKMHDPADDLSYGQQKLLSLVCCLASGSELLLLDEPVAGIAPQMMEKVLSIILELPGKGKSVLLIEHNMDAVTQICDRVIFMDAGRKLREGTAEEVRNDPQVIEAYLD